MSATAPLPDWKPELAAIVGARHGGGAAALLPRLRDLDVRFPDTPAILLQLGWTCEILGRYRDAAGYYDRAIAPGLEPHELSGALLGLGSALRCIGDYERATQVFRQGQRQFPAQREFEVFLALALYNLGHHTEAMRTLLATLIETADDVGIAAHQRTLRFLAGQLDKKWE